jgi:hypothetical protein
MESLVSSTDVLDQQTVTITRVRQIILLTQATFFLVLVICIAVRHDSVVQTDGISFYGVYHVTLPLLFLGFGVAAAGLWRSAALLSSTDVPPVTQWGLRAVALGLFVLLATPYNHGTFLNWAHMSAGVALAVLQLAISTALISRWRTPGSVVGIGVQLFGGVLAAASLPDWHFPYLLQGETIYQIGFGWCLIEWTNALRARRFVTREPPT